MKNLKIAVIVILGATALVYLSGYFYSYRLGQPEIPALAELSAANDVALDAVVEAKVTVELPLCQKIMEAKADPAGDGAAALPGWPAPPRRGPPRPGRPPRRAEPRRGAGPCG